MLGRPLMPIVGRNGNVVAPINVLDIRIIRASPSGTMSRTIASIKRVNPRGCWSVTNQSSGRLPQGNDASNHPSTRAQNHRIARERSSPLVHLPARNGTALCRGTSSAFVKRRKAPMLTCGGTDHSEASPSLAYTWKSLKDSLAKVAMFAHSVEVLKLVIHEVCQVPPEASHNDT